MSSNNKRQRHHTNNNNNHPHTTSNLSSTTKSRHHHSPTDNSRISASLPYTIRNSERIKLSFDAASKLLLTAKDVIESHEHTTRFEQMDEASKNRVRKIKRLRKIVTASVPPNFDETEFRRNIQQDPELNKVIKPAQLISLCNLAPRDPEHQMNYLRDIFYGENALKESQLQSLAELLTTCVKSNNILTGPDDE
jgi:hypothetical protein